MFKCIARLLPLLLLCLFHSGFANAQQPNRTPNLNLGDAVVTGFSGAIAPDPSKPRPANKSPIDLTFINPDGASAHIVDVSKPGYVWDGRLFAAPMKFDVLAKDVGQVFGVALDDAEQPNIYVAATSAFGLNIVKRGRDGLPERMKKGGPGAGWVSSGSNCKAGRAPSTKLTVVAAWCRCSPMSRSTACLIRGRASAISLTITPISNCSCRTFIPA